MPILEIAQADAEHKSTFWVKIASCLFAPCWEGLSLPGDLWADLWASRISVGNIQIAGEQTQLKKHRNARNWVPLLW